MKAPYRRVARRLVPVLLTGCSLASIAVTAHAQTKPVVATPIKLNPTTVSLPNSTGKFISQPPIGTVTNVGSLPFNLVASPNGKFAVATNIGYRQYLSVVDTATGALVSQKDYNAGLNGGLGSPSTGLYYGLVFNPNLNGDGTYTLYSAQGSFSTVEVLKLNATTGALTHADTISMKINGDFATGLALSADGKTLYVAVNEFSRGTADDILSPGSVSIIDTTTKTELGRYNFSAPLSHFPLPIVAVGNTVYVGSQRDGVVYAIDVTNPATPVLATTPYGSGAIPADTALNTFAHPLALVKSNFGPFLYIAGAHSDKLIVVNTTNNSIVNAIPMQPAGTAAANLPGATPTAIAENANGLLYVTLGDMNAVAVVNPTLPPTSAVQGYLPVGWYPTGVVAASNGNLLVTNAKGTQVRYANPGYVQYAFANAYDLNLIEGNVETISSPLTKLATGTTAVLANNRINNIIPPGQNPLSTQASQIKHVIYIIKENRTFDQVLGDSDVPGVNGDPTLTLFGAAITPNLHALAKRFVTLDNFFDCGEASGDGWPWSTQGQANEYVIKNLPYNYSGRGRNYDFEGQNNGYPVGGFGPGLSAAFPAGAPAIPDVSEAPGHHIWDNVLGHNLTYRNYGFFYTFGVPGLIPDNYPGGTALIPNSDLNFRRFDGNYADSEAYKAYGLTTPLATYGAFNAPSRYTEWKREFDGYVANNNLPNFETVRLMKDHTSGYYPNQYSPQSMVADNDYAVGQLVDAVSHSPFWNSTAIFVIEDDSQDGADHVDTHRSTCYVISPLIKRNALDHTFYNTDSVLKTMELLMGLPPMNQYDAVADYINDFDTTASNSEPYTAILPSKRVIGRKTPGSTAMKPGSPEMRLANLTKSMDFVHPDSANPKLLNEILWKAVKGVNTKMPAIKHDPKVEAKLHKSEKSETASSGKKATTTRDDD